MGFWSGPLLEDQLGHVFLEALGGTIYEIYPYLNKSVSYWPCLPTNYVHKVLSMPMRPTATIQQYQSKANTYCIYLYTVEEF